MYMYMFKNHVIHKKIMVFSKYSLLIKDIEYRVESTRIEIVFFFINNDTSILFYSL